MSQQQSSIPEFSLKTYIADNEDFVNDLVEVFNKDGLESLVFEIPNDVPREHKKDLITEVQRRAAQVDTPTTPRPNVTFSDAPSTAPSGITSLASHFGASTQPARTVATAPSTAPSAGAAAEPTDNDVQISEDDISALWDSVDDFDVTSVNKELIQAFEYQGFNPEAIVRSFLVQAKRGKVDKHQVIRDINTLCALAMIKGSINEHNLKKMTDKGKTVYSDLEARYGLTRGGGKGKPAEVITVSRVAAAFPNKVMELLQKGIVPARQFIGDFKTHNLPKAMQHQALAACTPIELAEKSKQFILDIVTAYSADQSKVISNSKEDSQVLFDRQLNFTNTAHLGPNPKSEVRIRLFKSFDWSTMFPRILEVASHIKTKNPAFVVVTQTDFMRDISKLP